MRRKTQINNVEGKKQQITTSDNITIGIYGIWFNPHILGGLWTMQKIERNTILSTSCFFSAEERVFSAILGKKIKMIVVLRVVNVVGWLVFFAISFSMSLALCMCFVFAERESAILTLVLVFLCLFCDFRMVEYLEVSTVRKGFVCMR